MYGQKNWCVIVSFVVLTLDIRIRPESVRDIVLTCLMWTSFIFLQRSSPGACRHRALSWSYLCSKKKMGWSVQCPQINCLQARLGKILATYSFFSGHMHSFEVVMTDLYGGALSIVFIVSSYLLTNSSSVGFR